MTKTTITINGRTYDAVTGMPVHADAAHHSAPRPAAHHTPGHKVMRAFSDFGPATTVKELHKPERPAYGADLAPVLPPHEVHAAAQAVHQVTQKSHTLYRRALIKPGTVDALPSQTTTADHQRSPLISKFGAHHHQATTTESEHPKKAEPIAPATVHPTVAKITHNQVAAHAEAHKPQLSGTDLKEQLIKERLAEVGDRPGKKEKKTNWLSRQPRLVTILSSTLALLILGGYLTYITLPSISLRVAASRAGVNANMPEYKPDGYTLDGPITYSPGEVVLSYKSTTNDSGYKLVQKATNWDSQAVLDNYVGKLTDNYLTFQEKGITVYTFGNKAAWVNAGLLYTIDGNAALSSDQILRVATSI